MGISKLTTILFYTTAFLALTGLGIWDVFVILRDYINDNRLTMVKILTVNRTYPFLTQTKFCLGYPPSIFATVGSVFGRNDTAAFIHESVHRGFDLLGNFSENKAVSENDLYLGLFYLNSAYELDELGPDFINRLKYIYRDTTEEDPDNASDIILDRLARLDAFIEHNGSIDFAKSVWQNLRGLFVKPRSTSNIREKTNLTTMDYSNICFHTPQWTIQTISHEKKAIYYLDIMNSEQHPPTDPQNILYSSSLRIYVSNKLVTDVIDAPKKGIGYSDISIEISNTGVFDSGEFPPCNNEFTDEEACLENVGIYAFIEVCDCIPFSHALKNAFQEDPEIQIPNPELIKLCTSKNYALCWKKAMENKKQKRAKARVEGTCVPCVFFKNAFQIQKRTVIYPMELFIQTEGRYNVRFQINDITFVLFKERQQIGVSQLISQVGGDLGLYIGFSMITFLELLIFLYSSFRRGPAKNLTGQETTEGRDKPPKCHGLFQNFMVHINRKIYHFEEDKERKLGGASSLEIQVSKEWVSKEMLKILEANQLMMREIDDLKKQVAMLVRSIKS